MITYIKQAWLILVLGLVFGTALAVVDGALGERIKANKASKSEQAAASLVLHGKGSATTEVIRWTSWTSADSTKVEHQATVYRVKNSKGRLAGWGVLVDENGYGDRIELIVGLNPDASRIFGYEVIYAQETPGLGDKISTDPAFKKQFGWKPTAVRLRAVKKLAPLASADAKTSASLLLANASEILALTGATISSQAVCDAIYNDLTLTGLTKELAKLATGKKGKE